MSLNLPIGIGIAIGLFGNQSKWGLTLAAAVMLAALHVLTGSSHFRDHLRGLGAGSRRWSVLTYLGLQTLQSGLLVAAPVLVISVLSFARGQSQADWSTQEKANAEHYILSAEADLAATKLQNAETPFQVVPRETLGELLRLKKTALAEAKLVHDDMLEKALPGMSKPYRDIYQRSLELTIVNLERRDATAEIKGSALHDQWVDWINARKDRVRIPR